LFCLMGVMELGSKANGLVEKFREICEKLGENERTEVTTYDSYEYGVYIANVVNPRSGKSQIRIELKAYDRFKPTVVITRKADFEELKKFVKWLEQRKEILDELDRINGMAKKATVASGIAL